MTFACRVHAVPLDEGRTIMLGDRAIALFRTPGDWYAIDAVCPHRGGPLADGIVTDRAVICPLHDRRYDLATGAALTRRRGDNRSRGGSPRRPRLRGAGEAACRPSPERAIHSVLFAARRAAAAGC